VSLIEGRFRARLGEFSLDADFSLPSHGVTALFGHSPARARRRCCG